MDHIAKFDPASKIKTLEQTAIVEAEKAKPSADPKHWAKRSCTKCYGRGIVGTVTVKKDTNTLINGQLCACASRAFVRWRDAFVHEYVKSHSATP